MVPERLTTELRDEHKTKASNAVAVGRRVAAAESYPAIGGYIGPRAAAQHTVLIFSSV